MIFVFGSNLAGNHAGGAAASAVKYEGAIFGRGVGPQGTSYAIPTMDEKFKPLPLPEIEKYVRAFLEYASMLKLQFFVTKIGCGIAGYKPEQIAPMFKDAPENCVMPEGWRDYDRTTPRS